jgi:hypothetical protein
MVVLHQCVSVHCRRRRCALSTSPPLRAAVTNPATGHWLVGVFLYGTTADIDVGANWVYNFPQLNNGVSVRAQPPVLVAPCAPIVSACRTCAR